VVYVYSLDLASWVLFFISEERLWRIATKILGENNPQIEQAPNEQTDEHTAEGEDPHEVRIQLETISEAAPAPDPILGNYLSCTANLVEYLKNAAHQDVSMQRAIATNLFMMANNGNIRFDRDVMPQTV
jgi:hypothetical protein